MMNEDLIEFELYLEKNLLVDGYIYQQHKTEAYLLKQQQELLYLEQNPSVDLYIDQSMEYEVEL